MREKSTTALVSAFSRAYHAENNKVKIFNDNIAKSLITEQEYLQISKSMSEGISFFNHSFKGTKEEALRWIVDNQLSPTPLGRAAFAEKALKTAVEIGAKQYLILGAGYDTFAYRQLSWSNKLRIFEIDHPLTAEDKKKRLIQGEIKIADNVEYIESDFKDENWQEALVENPLYMKNQISFCSILGLSYYLSKEDFKGLIKNLSEILALGSSIVFDYPDEKTYTDKAGERSIKQSMLAVKANEEMLASYSYENMEKILSDNGFLIYEHLMPHEITRQYFKEYNISNTSNMITAFDNVNYCLAVRK